ncbi:MAG: fructosamine kinase family protein [Deltaproteobacteria bacterium]|nr:fructosamine kinase family protein [Deltaproteobacteria bacterium]
MDAELREAVGQALGAAVVQAKPLSGGDINEAWAVQCGDGWVFVKSRPGAPASTFSVEARGLQWLAQTNALRTPAVLAYGEDPPFLALEQLTPGPPRDDFDATLGRGLAAMHRDGPAQFGLDHTNFIARLTQDNTPTDDWPTFYWERRLQPQLRLATDAGLADAGLRRELDALASRLPSRCGPPEPPARLHGDLWGGNLMVDDQGMPALIDPAVYGGHREIDLAMMQLFGGFSARVLAAYDEAHPLAPGATQRVPLYQLYPLLVHVNLFGGSYLGAVRRALASVR